MEGSKLAQVASGEDCSKDYLYAVLSSHLAVVQNASCSICIMLTPIPASVMRLGGYCMMLTWSE